MRPIVSIKVASDQTGLPTKTIRYYEDIGLLVPERAANGYRTFSENDLHLLQFLSKARGLGFSVSDCRKLMKLYSDQERASSDVKLVAREHVTQIDAKIAELRAMRSTLQHLINTCAGDDRPDCPILNELSSPR